MRNRQIRSAEEIRALVLQRVRTIRRAEDDPEIHVPLPTRTAADGDGCNWVMSVFGNAHAYLEAVDLVLRDTRAEVNLPEG